MGNRRFPWESWDYPWARAGIDAEAVSINLGASRGALRGREDR